MGKLYISEYVGIAAGAIPIQPPLAKQTLSIGPGSVASAAFQKATKIIRLHCDAICFVAFDVDPVATMTDERMAANQTEYFAIHPGHKVAVIGHPHS
jgi:hypothetical protein